MSQSSESLVDWMIQLDASGATKTLAEFVGKSKDEIKTLEDHSKQLSAFGPAVANAFTQALRPVLEASPHLAKTLENFAMGQNSAMGFAVALRQVGEQVKDFADLRAEIEKIDEAMKAGVIDPGTGRKALGHVSDEAERREAQSRKEKAIAEREEKEAQDRINKAIAFEEARWEEVDRKEAERRQEQLKLDMQAAEKLQVKRQEDARRFKIMAAGAVGLGTAIVKSSASAGFQDTLQGQQASVYQQQLNRQVASIFSPMLEERTRWVAKMTSTLQGLDEPQRKAIRTAMAFGTSFTTLAVVIPITTRGLVALAAASRAAAASQTGKAITGAAGGAAGPKGMGQRVIDFATGPAGIATGAIIAGLASTEKGRDALGKVIESMTPALEALGEVITQLTPALEGLAEVVLGLMPIIEAFGTGLGVILKAIAPIAPLLAGFALGGPLGAAIALGLTALGKNSESSGKSGSLSPVPKGFEDVDASFNRINEAATKLNLDQVRNDLLRQIANNTRPIGSAPNTNNTAPQGNQVGF